MPTVLVVDDDDALRELIQIGLNQYYNVVESSDAKSALAILKTHPEQIDLLLVDAGLPDLKGSDLANLARQVRPGIKCVIISGNPGNCDSTTHRFLPKPFQLSELNALVSEVLGSPDNRNQVVDKA
jgi:DNA-binding NtrC family response regulator